MKRIFAFGAPLIIILALVFWRLASNRAAAADTAKSQSSRKNAAASVDLAVAGPQTLTTNLEAVGTVMSPFKVDISPKVAGRIDFLEVREGDVVTKGQVLVRINPSDLTGATLEQQAAVSEAKAKLAQAEITKNSNDMTIKGSINQEQANLDTAKAEYQQAQQTYEAQVQTARSAVVDATAKVSSAQSDIRNNQAKVASAQADANNSKLKWQRQAKMLDAGYVAQQAVDDAYAAYQVSAKAVDVAQAALEGSQSALDSSKAQLDSANQQLSITKKKASVDVQTALAKVKQAQSQLDVAKAGLAGTAAYEANLDALREGVKSAQAQLDQAKAKEGETILTSTIDGTVTARNADPGSIANVGSAVVTVQFLKWLFVTVSLPIENANVVRQGIDVSLSFDAFPGRIWHGKISQVNPVADPQSRQFTFQVRMDNPDGSLRPGMFSKVLVPASSVQADVAVPKGAVDTSAGSPVVRVVDKDGVVSVRQVKVGASAGDYTQILDGVKAGEQVVKLSYTPLKDGAKVRLPKKDGSGGKGGSGDGQGPGGTGSGGGSGRKGQGGASSS